MMIVVDGISEVWAKSQALVLGPLRLSLKENIIVIIVILTS
jgi:hypothetical protein